jgi:hypothetical protein
MIPTNACFLRFKRTHILRRKNSATCFIFPQAKQADAVSGLRPKATSTASARIDADRVGLSIQAFVQIQMVSHSPEQAKSLSRLLETRPEVVSGWTLTGDADYLLRVYCKDLPSLNLLIHETLLPHPAVARVQSQIVMDQVKPDSPLPI